jgi:hypothetical protein
MTVLSEVGDNTFFATAVSIYGCQFIAFHYTFSSEAQMLQTHSCIRIRHVSDIDNLGYHKYFFYFFFFFKEFLCVELITS